MGSHHQDESSDRLASPRYTAGNSESPHSGKQSCSRRLELRRGSFCPEFASEVVGLHTEKERVAENPLREGLVLISQRRQASAAVYKRAQADLLRA